MASKVVKTPLMQADTIIVDSLAEVLHDGRASEHRLPMLVATVYGKRVANPAWILGTPDAKAVHFEACAAKSKLRIFLSEKFKRKHPQFAKILQQQFTAKTWETIPTWNDFLSQREAWRPRISSEPIAIVSASEDVGAIDEKKGVLNLDLFVKKIQKVRK